MNADGVTPLSISVVVASYQRPAPLDRLLRSLSDQTVLPNQVIVVDDGSTPPIDTTWPGDDTTEFILHRQPNGGPGSARHTGICHASGDIIVIVDDDMIVDRRFIDSHVRQHLAGFDVVQGRFDPPSGLRLRPWEAFVQRQQDQLFSANEGDHSFDPIRLSTGNVSFRRNLYLDAGGFNLELRRREDADLGLRLAAQNASFGYAPEQTAVHDEPPEPLERWKRVAFEYGESDAEMATLHPEYEPWRLVDDMPLIIRVMVKTLKPVPSVGRMFGHLLSYPGLLLERVGAHKVSVNVFGVIFAVLWFSGMSAGLRAQRRDPETVDFGGVRVDVIEFADAVDKIVELARQPRVSIVVTPNTDHLVMYRRDAGFAATYDRADLVLADGMPLILVSRLLRLPLTTKVSGSDLAEPLLRAAATAGHQVFLFGATEATTAAAERALRSTIPDIDIVGASSPWYTPGRPDGQIDQALQQITASGANLILVAFGAPKQEQLMAEFADRLPDGCYVCCGATLDFIAGNVSRAPAWMSKVGAEWLYRLAQEPGRLWKRYLVRDVAALPIFASMTLQRIRRIWE